MIIDARTANAVNEMTSFEIIMLMRERDALKATLHKIATENLGAIDDRDWKRRAKVMAENALRDLK